MIIHPSITIYSCNEMKDADVILNGRIIYSGTEYRAYAEHVSAQLWTVEVIEPLKDHAIPRIGL